jgi:molybdenum cofactor cytidylyltransferase
MTPAAGADPELVGFPRPARRGIPHLHRGAASLTPQGQLYGGHATNDIGTIPRMVPAVVLAAGQSSRMGRPKALLPCGGDHVFVTRLVTALREGGAAGAFVVGRPDDQALRDEVDRLAPFGTFIVNAAPERGQLSSLIAGLDAADRPGVRAVVVSPVDVPLVTPAAVATLLAAFVASGAPIVRAVHAGAHGHPVIFARALFDELRHADPSRGAKAVLRTHEDRILNVEVNDSAVLTDFDVPEDYERVFGRRP